MAKPSLWKLLGKGAYDKLFNFSDESSLAEYINELDLDDPEILETIESGDEILLYAETG